MRDHTAGIREGRAYVDAGSPARADWVPGAVPHGGDRGRRSNNQQRTRSRCRTAGKKVRGLDERWRAPDEGRGESVNIAAPIGASRSS